MCSVFSRGNTGLAKLQHMGCFKATLSTTGNARCSCGLSGGQLDGTADSAAGQSTRPSRPIRSASSSIQSGSLFRETSPATRLTASIRIYSTKGLAGNRRIIGMCWKLGKMDREIWRLVLVKPRPVVAVVSSSFPRGVPLLACPAVNWATAPGFPSTCWTSQQ